MRKFYILVLLLSVFTRKGNLLMCYECLEFFDKDCGEDFESANIKKVECEGHNDVCMIHKSPPIWEAPEIYQRGCVDQHYCNKIDEYSEHCVICDEDLCNASSTTVPSFIVILNIILMYFRWQ